jgi:hypothetical protein
LLVGLGSSTVRFLTPPVMTLELWSKCCHTICEHMRQVLHSLITLYEQCHWSQHRTHYFEFCSTACYIALNFTERKTGLLPNYLASWWPARFISMLPHG